MEKTLMINELMINSSLLTIKEDLEVLEEKLNKANNNIINDSDNYLSKIKKGFSNVYTSIISQRKDEIKNIEVRLAEKQSVFDEIKNNAIEQGLDVYYSDDIIFKNKVQGAFNDDVLDYNKLTFIYTFIFGSDGIYDNKNLKSERETDLYGKLSDIFFNDSKRIKEFKCRIEKTYQDLSVDRTMNKKNAIIAGVILGTATLALCPVLLGGLGASAAITTASLNSVAFGSGMAEGAFLLAGLPLTCAVTAGVTTYTVKNIQDKRDARKMLAEMSYDETALALSLYYSLIKEIETNKDIDAVALKKMLLQIYIDLKVDIDTEVYLTQKNCEQNKKKVEIFHRMDNKLLANIK
ncbi:MAG: hypothetical protein MSA47_00550 [Christensenellaceae bacterium]|nr:hypothetical protein [Christensenellaceae bacterium]